MRITGNKGEWSELYALLKLLSLGRLYTADENLERIEQIYFPILKILRDEEYGHVDLIITPSGDVEVQCNNVYQRIIPHKFIREMSSYLYEAIREGSQKSAFEIDGSSAIMNRLNINRIAAASSDKTDITLQIHDIYTGFNPVCGFSIKSELGGSPTLLNASGATNFVYCVPYMSRDEITRINSIDTRSKARDRVKAILSHGAMNFSSMQSTIFQGNLMLVDTQLEAIIAEMLLYYYSDMGTECSYLIKLVERNNSMRFPRQGFYSYKFKKFLCTVALGMMPGKVWDGVDEANGGYVIVKQDGDVVAYHLYNRNAFEDYLLNNTKFETPSTSRHGFATIYKGDDGQNYFKLNLQIRFI